MIIFLKIIHFQKHFLFLLGVQMSILILKIKSSEDIEIDLREVLDKLKSNGKVNRYLIHSHCVVDVDVEPTPDGDEVINDIEYRYITVVEISNKSSIIDVLSKLFELANENGYAIVHIDIK